MGMMRSSSSASSTSATVGAAGVVFMALDAFPRGGNLGNGLPQDTQDPGGVRAGVFHGHDDLDRRHPPVGREVPRVLVDLGVPDLPHHPVDAAPGGVDR